MTLFKMTSITLLAFAASTAQAQNVTTSSGDIVMIEKQQNQVVVNTAAPATAVVVAPATGLTPLGLSSLTSAGPLALGLGAIIAVGAIAAGNDTN